MLSRSHENRLFPLIKAAYSANTTHRLCMKGGGHMDFAIKRVLLKPEEQTDATREAIREVCRQLENVRARFEMENDSDLIEACIYEMESLRARYRYLLRQAKAKEMPAGTSIQEKNG